MAPLGVLVCCFFGGEVLFLGFFLERFDDFSEGLLCFLREFGRYLFKGLKFNDYLGVW